MIFVTVGTQLPFPRLVEAVAGIVGDESVFAQVGPDKTTYPFPCAVTVSAHQFETLGQQARVIVAHAGIGTVMAARRWGKPLILMPRRAEFKEHRNNHQIATARELEGRAGISVAWQSDDLSTLLRQPLSAPVTTPSEGRAQLIAALRAFAA